MTQNTRMVFYPRIMVVKSVDVILFKATNKGHNSASIEGMLPVGAEAWKGKINKDIEVKFDVPVIYGY